MLGIGVCQPDETCRGGTEKIIIKNPVNYAFRKMRKPARKVKKKYREKGR
jgi:hypothetical protein